MATRRRRPLNNFTATKSKAGPSLLISLVLAKSAPPVHSAKVAVADIAVVAAAAAVAAAVIAAVAVKAGANAMAAATVANNRSHRGQLGLPFSYFQKPD
jgi:hypothetical protein